MQYRLYKCVLICYGLTSLTALNVEFKTLQRVYNVGDNVTLTCNVTSNWITVTLQRNKSDICDCFSTLGGCIPTNTAPSHYRHMVYSSKPTLIINNVTLEDNDVNFTCQWKSYTDTVSFYVQAKVSSTKTKDGDIISTVVFAMVTLASVTITGVAIIYIYCKRNVVKTITWPIRRRCKGATTGITADQYKQMKRETLEMEWKCAECKEQEMQIDADLSIPPALELDIPTSPVRELLNATYVVRDSIIEDNTEPSTAEMDIQNSFIEDRSFNVSRSFVQPAPYLDDSLRDPPLDDSIPDDVPVTFNVVEGGTKRGGQKLISSDGYTYTRRNAKEGRVYWTCSIRGKAFKCTASVKQYGDMFTPSINGHQHPADPGALKKVEIAIKVKEVARDNVFRPAGDIVETVMKDLTSVDDFALPRPDLLTRTVNRHRQKFRPKDPTTLDFEINAEYIGPDFIVDDIRVDDQRHVLLATTAQLQQLKQARRWFLDGTFKLVKRPFYQLMSVHAFVRKGEDAKQVPLAYVLMSRRSKQDYIAVLTSLRSKLERPQVEWFMLDFEAAAWQAIREVFPGCVLKGCVFHWSQRIYRKIQSEGLASAYLQREDRFRFLRKLLSLPYLPSEQIPETFHQLKEQALDVEGPILRVTQYVQDTWIEGRMWSPTNWSVFRETVRTNNDVEGWHRRINTKAGRSGLEFYLLVPLLRRESETVDLQIRLVSAHLLTRLHRARYARVHGALCDAWDEYEDGNLTTTQLLRRCSQIAGLGPATQNEMPEED